MTTFGPAAAATIAMTVFTSFAPAAVTVKVGEMVEWVNQDNSDPLITHDVTWDRANDAPLNSPRHMKNGDIWQVNSRSPAATRFVHDPRVSDDRHDHRDRIDKVPPRFPNGSISTPWRT
ncbi:MAG: hypothetical protein M3077_08065 [Candidatus Dormibacteraeota bacterium]|nr:hypothetical protein [Candidatus Dormibacteraeota bacterium]